MNISRRSLLILAGGIPLCLLLAVEVDWTLKAPLLVVTIAILIYAALSGEGRADAELVRLRTAYDQLDQQAKLIIQTDLELHRTQEELDRKLSSLAALHDLSQQLRVSLRPQEIYGKLTGGLIGSCGFSKALIGIVPSETGELRWTAMIGFTDQTAEPVRQHLASAGLLRETLAVPAPRALDTRTTANPKLTTLLRLLASKGAVLAGIKPHTGPPGVLLLAKETADADEWAGDEELVAILAAQLASAVENSCLYEEMWKAGQASEAQVQARTRELAEANTQLTQMNKSKSTFVSTVSHELRTPLAAVKGYASLLRTGQFGPLTDAQTERLAKIEKHADLLTNFISNLLDIARIESGRVVMERRPLEVQEFFGGVLDVVKPQLDAKRIKFTLEPGGVASLLGDPAHLPRVLINLLSNALKYTPEGGTIRVTLRADAEQVTVSVRDSGCGIAADELPKLFQEFFRSTNPINETVKGTGLGLTLVKRIIEAHHGAITVASEPGKGTTFTFTLPRTASTAAAETEAP